MHGTASSHDHHVVELVLGALDWITPETRELIGILATSGGSPHVPNDLARDLGLRNRHQLARLLARQNLPTLEILAAWIRVFGWLLNWERDRIPLARGALEEGQDPAVRFRTVRDIVGCTWRELQERGSAWLMLELRNRYQLSSTDNGQLA